MWFCVEAGTPCYLITWCVMAVGEAEEQVERMARRNRSRLILKIQVIQSSNEE